MALIKDNDLKNKLFSQIYVRGNKKPAIYDRIH